MLLQGLVSKREYNRKSARVMSFDDLVGRYMVALDDGKELSLIKAECVTREGGQSVDGKVHEPVVALAAAQPTALYVLSWANGSFKVRALCDVGMEVARRTIRIIWAYLDPFDHYRNAACTIGSRYATLTRSVSAAAGQRSACGSKCACIMTRRAARHSTL